MDPGSPIFRAAIEKYVESKDGFEFYANSVDPAASSLSKEGLVVLRKKRSREVVAEYKIDELGLSREDVNLCLPMALKQGKLDAMPGEREGDVISISIGDLEKKVLYSLIASIVMALGTLAPIVRLPVVGTINYLKDGRADGVVVLVVAIVAAYFSLLKKYSLVGHMGRISLTICLASLWHFQFALSKARESMDELGDNMFRGLGDAIIGSIGIEWGWVPLIGGAVSLIVIPRLIDIDGRLSIPVNALKLNGRLSLSKIPVQLFLCLMIALAVGGVASMNGSGSYDDSDYEFPAIK